MGVNFIGLQVCSCAGQILAVESLVWMPTDRVMSTQSLFPCKWVCEEALVNPEMNFLHIPQHWKLSHSCDYPRISLKTHWGDELRCPRYSSSLRTKQHSSASVSALSQPASQSPSASAPNAPPASVRRLEYHRVNGNKVRIGGWVQAHYHLLHQALENWGCIHQSKRHHPEFK